MMHAEDRRTLVKHARPWYSNSHQITWMTYTCLQVQRDTLQVQCVFLQVILQVQGIIPQVILQVQGVTLQAQSVTLQVQGVMPALIYHSVVHYSLT